MFRTLTTLTLVILSAFSANAAGRRIEVLFLGDNGHHQPGERFYELLQGLEPKGINLTYTDRLEDINTANLAQYDAVAIYANIDKITPLPEQALLSYVRGGKGLVPIHCASYCFQNSPEYIKMVGAQFKSHGTGDFTTRILLPDHPVMKGFKGFSTWDETYVHTAHNTANRTVLQERDGEPYTWVRTEGKGRVFYTAYGHDYRTFTQPAFHNLIYRGIRYAVGDAVAQQLDALKLPPLRYVDNSPKPVPNYEKRDPAPQLQEPLSPEDAEKHIQVPVETDVTLFASEKEGLWNVIDLKFDERGRLWTTESLDYPNELKPQGQGRDRIRILEDTNGDGKADKVTVFATGLSIPTSLVFANGGVIVTAPPETILLRDTNGDGKSDEKKALFSGWGTGDTHAGPSNLRYGFDGWIWATVGYSGFDGRVGGESHKFSQGVVRFKPDGSKLELVGKTSNNTWGLGFTENFDILGSTANNQHAWYVAIPKRFYDAVDGLDMGMVPGIETPDSKRMAISREYVRQVDVWRKTDAGMTWGYTAAAAQTVYTARAFPKDYWNRASLVAEPTGHLLGRGFLQQEGTNFSFTRGWNLMVSDDEWFAPVAAEVGPDGAVWVSDFYSFLVQHNPTPSPDRGGFKASTGKGNAFVSDLRDTEHARLWRVAAKKSIKKPTILDARSAASLVSGLKDDVLNTRLHAQRLLVERGEKDVVPQLIALVDDRTVDAAGISAGAQHAVWTLSGLGALDDATAAKALKHPAQGVRRAALACINRTTPASTQMVVDSGTLTDKEPLVQLGALLALAELPANENAGKAVAVLARDPSVAKDRNLSVALTMAAAKHSIGYLATALAEATPIAADSQAAMTSTNLVTNPGFEKLLGSAPLDWSPANYTGKATHALTAAGRTGRAAQISSVAGADASWQCKVTLEPNTDYLLSAWIKTENLTDATGALLEIHSLNGAQPKSNAIKGTTDWTMVSFKINSGNQREILLNCLFGGWGLSKGSAWFDDISVTKTGGSSAPGSVDVHAVTRSFSRTASPNDMAAMKTLIAAKPSALGRSISDGLGSSGAAPAATDDIATLEKTHQVIRLKAIEGMKYDVMNFEVRADKPIALVFSNGDQLQHNLVVAKPGSIDACCKAADGMALQPDAIAKSYVPSVPDILKATKLLNPGETEVIKLDLKQPGQYPYLCTFPGHCHIMRGTMTVR